MSTIGDYPVPTSLDGSELLAGFKAGRQVAIPPALLNPAGAGTPGLSAYQLWRQAGNTGTLADFLASLVGPAYNPGYTPADAAKLAAANGSGLVGSTNPAAGAVARTALDRQNDLIPTFRDFGADPTGVKDCTSLVAAMNAAGSMRLTAGRYLFSSSVTITASLIVEPGARLFVTGGTVTFTADPQAGEFQIFNLSGQGAVAGLLKAKAEWFIGDARGTSSKLPTVECSGLIQAALNSVAIGGALSIGAGHWLINGLAPLNAAEISIKGAGAGLSVLRWAGKSTNGISMNPSAVTVAKEVSGIGFTPHVPGTIPTAGCGITLNDSSVSLSDFALTDPYQGFFCAGGVLNTYRNFYITGAVNYGILVKANDQYFSDFAVAALNDWVTLSNVTGTFNVGDTITLGSSAGAIAVKYDATHFRIFFNDVQPAVGNTITSSSGGSATIAALTISHNVGGFRTEGNVEALSIGTGEVLGGLLSLAVASYSNATGRSGNLSFGVFKKVFFDTSYQGAFIAGMFNCEFQGTWFSNSRGSGRPGISLTLCQGNFGKLHLVSNSGWGLYADQACLNNEFELLCDGNCRNYTTQSDMAEIALKNAIQRMTIRGGRAGFQGGNGVTPPKALWLDAAASDYIKVIGLSVPGASSVNWGSTGTHNRRIAVDGMADI